MVKDVFTVRSVGKRDRFFVVILLKRFLLSTGETSWELFRVDERVTGMLRKTTSCRTRNRNISIHTYILGYLVRLCSSSFIAHNMSGSKLLP